MLSTANFGFLAKQDQTLVQLGAMAERYFRDDPSTCLLKLRQFAEVLAKLVAAHHRLYEGERDTFEETLRRLSYDRALPRETADVFHQLRRLGNAAAHELSGSHAEALSGLKLARQLGIWFFRTYAKQSAFKPGPFIPPPEPVDATASLQAEIEALRQKVEEARREAEGHAQARETAEMQFQREAADRAVWEQLAQDYEDRLRRMDRDLPLADMAPDPYRQSLKRRKLDLAHQLGEPPPDAIAASLAAVQASAEQAPAAEVSEFLRRGADAAAQIDLDETATRERIDQQLRDRGWEADTKTLRFSEGVGPAKGRNMAIAEWPTASGPADYALFVGTMLVAMVEAKRQRKNVSAAIDQAERYATTVASPESGAFAGGPWGEHRVPFVFATNSRAYLKQIETESGIWFRDVRRAANHRRALVDWPTPEGLSGLLDINQDAATHALEDLPFDFGFPLRDYQQKAIKAVENALSDEKRTMLLAMATGTGKTKLAIAMLYRLLATKRFNRICFVVDRSALGEQAAGEFTTTKVISGRAFADIFGVKKLADITPETDTKVHICTIQGLVKRVLYAADNSEAPPVDQYDLIVVDECHRGYLLDREMSDAELSFRGQEDYISKYRRVLDYFDAVKIGLTATPALHTTEIFGEPIFKYSYRDAVIDGYLIDHEPPIRINTALAQAGIKFEKDQQLDLLNTRTGEIDLAHAPDDIRFEVDQFNKKVVTIKFNRVVAEELAKHIDSAEPDKTLIFAATDAHADIVVAQLKEAFAARYGEVEDAAIKKITGSVDRVQTLIRSFRNDANPKIAVTVDLLTTGIDVPKITNLVFLRRVNSRILYEQMIGRATRLCPEIGKEVFRIFDAVDLYPHLQNLTEMKPVVINPSLNFEKLIAELVAVQTDAEREIIREQLAVKLRRKLKKLTPEQREMFEAVAGETPEKTLERLLEEAPEQLSTWFLSRRGLAPILDWQADGDNPRFIPISHHDDRVVDVTRGYGNATRPEDFLDGFATFVRDNVNTIAALNVVVRRPRNLTRADLHDLRRALDLKGYTEANLRTAWSQARNQDIAAPIIAFVRQAALGDPLVPYSDRVRAAMQKIIDSRQWTEPQKRWLRRIGEQIEKETVVDRPAMDRDPFILSGGFTRLNKVFDGSLENVLAEINEELWKRTA
jgi:type I restriction enzyme R subunit